MPSHLPPPLVEARSLRKWQRNQGRWKLSLCEALCGENAGCSSDLSLQPVLVPDCVSYSTLVRFPPASWSLDFVFTYGLLLVYSSHLTPPNLPCFLLSPEPHLPSSFPSSWPACLPAPTSSVWTEGPGYGGPQLTQSRLAGGEPLKAWN